MPDASEFLGVIFDQCQGVVVTVNGRFITRRWKPGQPVAADQVYFCISTVREPDPRQGSGLSRKSQDLVLTYLVVVDDVGTKVSRETLLKLLPPSYKLLTSQPQGIDNEQWGWLFDVGVEPDRAAALIEALANAGLTDKGAKRADRVMRFPGSLNTKYDPPFEAKLLEWHPERLYTFSEVCAGLGVTPTDTPLLSAPAVMPNGKTDPLVAQLYKLGLVTGSASSAGWLPLTCPREAEHSLGPDMAHGCDYRPGWPVGTFKCMHEHGGAPPTDEWFKDWLLEQALAGAPAGLRKALDAIPARPASPTPPSEKELREAILDDLVHVGIESAYWSVGGKCMLSHKAVDDRLHATMLPTGMLDRENDKGDPLMPMSPSNWLKHQPDTRRVSRIIHRLGEPLIVDDCLNIAPLLPERAVGEGEPTPWLELISFICKGNQDDAEQIMDWLAMLVTAWNEKPGWHLLLRGPQGLGKGMLMRPMLWYLKPDHHQDVKPVNLDARFNGYLAKRLISVNELKMNTRGATTGHDIYNVVKGYMSGDSDTITIEHKGMEPIEVRDLSCWVLMSNEGVPLPLEADDRRFMVIETPSSAERWSKEKYRGVAKWLQAGGNACVIAWLHRRWDAMTEEWREVLREHPPMTAAKQELITNSADGIDGAVRLAMEGHADKAWPNLMQASDVLFELTTNPHFRLISESMKRNITLQRVGMALKAAGAVRLFGDQQVRGKDRKLVRLWCLRPSMVRMYEALGQGEKLIERYRVEQAGNISWEEREQGKQPD